MFKFSTLALTLITLASASLVQAKTPCENAKLDASAKATLANLESLLRQKRPDLDRKDHVANVESCSPTDILRMAANPGEMIPQIKAPETCGAVLVFSQPADAHTVARYLRGKNLGGAVCVRVLTMNPHPVVSTGN